MSNPAPALTFTLDGATIEAIAAAVAERLQASTPAPDPAPAPAQADAIGEHEAAALAGLSVHTLRNWRQSRTDGPPWRKVGRRVTYSRRQISTWLDQQTIEASR